MRPARIFLSPPHMGADEFEFVREGFATNWIAPVGRRAYVEQEFAEGFVLPRVVPKFRPQGGSTQAEVPERLLS